MEFDTNHLDSSSVLLLLVQVLLLRWQWKELAAGARLLTSWRNQPESVIGLVKKCSGVNASFSSCCWNWKRIVVLRRSKFFTAWIFVHMKSFELALPFNSDFYASVWSFTSPWSFASTCWNLTFHVDFLPYSRWNCKMVMMPFLQGASYQRLPLQRAIFWKPEAALVCPFLMGNCNPTLSWPYAQRPPDPLGFTKGVFFQLVGAEDESCFSWPWRFL